MILICMMIYLCILSLSFFVLIGCVKYQTTIPGINAEHFSASAVFFFILNNSTCELHQGHCVYGSLYNSWTTWCLRVLRRSAHCTSKLIINPCVLKSWSWFLASKYKIFFLWTDSPLKKEQLLKPGGLRGQYTLLLGLLMKGVTKN